ncbi:reverse transcriptase domain-containing protein [Tanacetum coccineum]|uniref:Reverse transcriptase domain-containing protein n=1 Tax=Tanacetum coccineum TaxID=301880 RepID=A0ABQ5CMD8_9ASTR
MIREGGNRKRSFEEERSGLTDELTFPVIPQNQLTDEPIILEGIIEGNQVRRILVEGESSSEIMYEHCFRNLDVSIRLRFKRCEIPMVGFLGETYHPLVIIDLRVTMGRVGRNKMVLMEFAIIKCRSPYNVIIGRTGMRSLGAVGSTIHSMIKFPTNQGIVTMETSREALWECQQLERVQGSWKEVQWRQREEQMSRIREQVILRTKSNSKRGPDSGPVSFEKHRAKKTQGRVCAKDMYPFSEEGEELASLMGYPYKCFLRIPKEYSQIRMAEDDEEKTGFHTEEGVYCFTHMPKELKNSAATLQRMMEKVLVDQRGQNMEIYLEEVVIKSKSELDLFQDVEETLRKLKRVNIVIDPVTSSFGEAKGSVVKKFSGQGEQVQEILDENEGGTLNLNKELQAKSTPTPRAWRLYLGKETIEEGLAASANQGMKDLHVFIDSLTLVPRVEGNHTPATEQERKYKEEIMDATTLFHRFRITHVPKILNLKVEVLTGLATIKLEFLNQEVSVGIKIRPLVEETSSNKKGKAPSNAPGAKPNYNHEASGSN